MSSPPCAPCRRARPGTLEEGLDGLRAARLALGRALTEREALPARLVDDPAALARLAASADTLDAFASAFAPGAGQDGPAAPEPGAWPLPVPGTVLRAFREADAAGTARPGIILATRPGALVTAPVAASLRYAGPLDGYGLVIVLEPGPGLLLVLAGLAEVYGTPGEVVAAGAPLGLMGGPPQDAGAIAREAARGAGGERTETLYLEARERPRAGRPGGLVRALDGRWPATIHGRAAVLAREASPRPFAARPRRRPFAARPCGDGACR